MQTCAQWFLQSPGSATPPPEHPHWKPEALKTVFIHFGFAFIGDHVKKINRFDHDATPQTFQNNNLKTPNPQNLNIKNFKKLKQHQNPKNIKQTQNLNPKTPKPQKPRKQKQTENNNT